MIELSGDIEANAFGQLGLLLLGVTRAIRGSWEESRVICGCMGG